MPNTETPKAPEQNEKPQKPSPETRVKKNEKSENSLRSRSDRKLVEYLNYQDRESTKILDEANKGEEAWHEAHKQRNNLTQTERRTEPGKQADAKIDELRKGKLDGKKRRGSPEDILDASYIRERRGRGVTVNITPND